MAETTTGPRRKIDSAADLKAVVRTMKASAASSITQYEQSVAALADYARNVDMGLTACLRTAERTVGPAVDTAAGWARHEAASVGAIVFGSDQSLVGRFNEVVVDHALEALARLPDPPRVWAVGARAQSRLADAGLAPAGVFPLPGSVRAIAPLVGRILVEIEAAREVAANAREVAELHLFYNRREGGAGYAPASQRLLPLDDTWPTGAGPRPTCPRFWEARRRRCVR